MVETESKKVLGANSYVCRSYTGKTGRELFCPLPSWIGLIVWPKKVYFVNYEEEDDEDLINDDDDEDSTKYWICDNVYVAGDFKVWHDCRIFGKYKGSERGDFNITLN